MRTKEELAEYHRQYYLANKERIREYQRGYWDRMGNELNRRRRKRRQTDPEWRESERLRVAAYAELKRAEDPRWRRPVKDTPGRPKGASN